MTNSAAEKFVASACSKRASGFTLIEILMALAIVAILTAISFPLYTNYINQAKVTVAISALESTNKALEVYYIDNHDYPQTIDFTTGVDGLGNTVLPAELLNEFKKNIFSVESYAAVTADYTLIARAMDTKHTLLTLKPSQGITKGP